MNKIIFDLNDCKLTDNDFMVLIDKCIEPRIMVNGYIIEWKYTINKGIVELSASLVNLNDGKRFYENQK